MIEDMDAMTPGGRTTTTTEALLLDHFAALASAPGGVRKLRELILQLAVQGRLVPQNSADEPAEVLLERIAAEKRRLAKEGTIRKATPLPPVGEDEVPFEVPEGWVWTKLGSIISFGPKNGYSSVAVDYPSNTKCLTLTATTYGSFNSAWKFP